jgi:hypothetical protein
MIFEYVILESASDINCNLFAYTYDDYEYWENSNDELACDFCRNILWYAGGDYSVLKNFILESIERKIKLNNKNEPNP